MDRFSERTVAISRPYAAPSVAKLPAPPGSGGDMVTSVALEHLKGKAVLVGRLGR